LTPLDQYLASAANDKVVVTYIKGDAHDVTEITAGVSVWFHACLCLIIIGPKIFLKRCVFDSFKWHMKITIIYLFCTC